MRKIVSSKKSVCKLVDLLFHEVFDSQQLQGAEEGLTLDVLLIPNFRIMVTESDV